MPPIPESLAQQSEDSPGPLVHLNGGPLSGYSDTPESGAMLLETGPLRVLAFIPQGWDRQTTHAEDEIYLIAEGTGLLWTLERTFAAQKGDLLVIPNGITHWFDDYSAGFRVWTLFADALDPLSRPSSPTVPASPDSADAPGSPISLGGLAAPLAPRNPELERVTLFAGDDMAVKVQPEGRGGCDPSVSSIVIGRCGRFSLSWIWHWTSPQAPTQAEEAFRQTAPEHLIYWIAQGTGVLRCSDPAQAMTVTADDLLHVPAGQAHGFDTVSEDFACWRLSCAL